MPLLLSKPNCQRSFTAESYDSYRFPSHNLPGPYIAETDHSVRQWTEADKAGSFPPGNGGCLTSLWPLAVASPPVGKSPFGGIAEYSGR